MNAVATRRPPAVSTSREELREARALKRVRFLIFGYLVLLLVEGSLRKWILPQLSNAILIIRDPVAVAIYYYAIRARVFRWNTFVIALLVIALLSCLTSVVSLFPYLPLKTILLVTAYGVRSDFLHLPLIFIFAQVLNFEDVKRIGWWTILLMIPMGLLMALQFRASPEAFINRTAGLGDGQQINTSGGKIRPPGSFSFISGAIFYLSSATAFLLHAALSKLPYKTWLLVAAGLSLLVAVGVSGSRGAVLAVGLVIASLGLIMVVRPSAMTSFGRNLLICALVALVATQVPIFWEGIGVLAERFTEAAAGDSDRTVASGLISRVFEGFTDAARAVPVAPVLGYGLGIGTNGGARLLVGQPLFLLTEGEWTRILLESGPILGLGFLIWRAALVCRIGYLAFRQLALGNTLPIVLFNAGVFALLNGSLGQPTSAGFAVVLNGLCLAAAFPPETNLPSDGSSARGKGVLRRAAGRSAYANRLHGPAAPPAHINGSADR